MNFDDTPQEAAFRAEAKAWIGANATALGLGSLSYWEDQLIDRMRKKNAA